MEVLDKGKNRVDQQVRNEHIILYRSFWLFYFYVTDFEEQVIMRRKQLELDALPRTNTSENRYAVSYYKVWHVEAPESCFSHFLSGDPVNTIHEQWYWLISFSPEEIVNFERPRANSPDDSQDTTEASFFHKWTGNHRPGYEK